MIWLSMTISTSILWVVLAGSCYPNCAASETIDGPSSPSQSQAWLQQWTNWRKQTLASVNYNPKVYDNDIKWTQTSFMQPQMMAHDRYFYDPIAQKYTVDKYMKDVIDRYGGIDSVLIWPTYPNIGVDARNQFDMVRDMPAGFKQAIAEFKQKYNVSVLLPYNPWDNGTQEPKSSNPVVMAELLQELGADGFNGDTMEVVPQEFFTEALKRGGPIAIEPELGGDPAHVWYTKMSWGYWTLYPSHNYPTIPAVGMFKWLEHRHLVNVCERWATDRRQGLQAAFFNGVGYETWENVWGIWNSISQRDSAAINRLGNILRFAGGLFGGGNAMDDVEWTPYDNIQNVSSNIFVSKFSTDKIPIWGRYGAPGRLTHTVSGSPYVVWTMINRETSPITFSMSVPYQKTCYDIYHGVQLTANIQEQTTVTIDALGYLAVLCVPPNSWRTPVLAFVAQMNKLSSTPLSQLSTATPVLSQTMQQYQRSATPGPIQGMIKVPGGSYQFYSTGREIEGQHRPGVDFQYPWESGPQLRHYKTFQMSDFYIDQYPVTNEQFHAFLQQSGYQPRSSANFLKDWQNGAVPSGWERKPVTWVDLDDAQAYCAHVGGRLPNEWEWQYAAQGGDGRLYPWGSSWNASNVPTPDTSRNPGPPPDVGQRPHAASPFGVQDLTGVVWQMTNKFCDEHTCALSLKGGSLYQPQGSKWYFPNTERVLHLDSHGKFLLVAPSLDRSRYIGFRCMNDA